ncbi:MAG TPA: TMEM175 family protein, partial [Thermoplasmata archaeon]|nr:TMEM175 family protein [Thermoplasmata archaeon]
FAFAMTLLVLGLVLPLGTVGGAVPAYFQTSTFQAAILAYVLSFFVIGMWWQGHHLIFGYIERFDRVLIRANSLFLVFIAIVPFATIVLNAAGNAPFGVGFYAFIQIATGLALASIWWYAAGHGHLVVQDFPDEWRRYLNRSTLYMPVVFAASIPVAFWNVRAAEGVWLLVFVAWFISRRQFGRSTTPAADGRKTLGRP